jgi:Flp pilus assembly protein TadG
MRRWRFRRKGQSLVEFSLIAMVLYFLFAGILTFGQLLSGAQTAQSAADTAAREIARLPLPPATSVSGGAISLYDVLYNPAYNGTQVRTQVFDPQYLMVNLTTSLPAGTSLADWVKNWPVVNQMLYPLMIVNYVNTSNNQQNGQNQQEWLLYPGVVAGTDSNGWPAYRVALVTNRDATSGAERKPSNGCR